MRLEGPVIGLADRADVESLPAGLRAEQLVVRGCRNLRELPPRLDVWHLDASATRLRALPPDLRVAYRIELRDCVELEALPAGLKTNSLFANGCAALRQLPEDLDCRFIDLTGCTSLAAWPERGPASVWRLRLRDCVRVTRLPSWLEEVAQLDLSGCSAITELPQTLRVLDWIDVGGTALEGLPASCAGANLRWRGVPVDARIAFQPDSINARDVLAETNVELRRVLLERMGYERFVEEAKAKVLDTDRDPGGERRLLSVAMGGDEDLVCVYVKCPSTGRQYAIRVPPTMRSCRAAVAWIAGFDNPNDYKPVIET